MSSLQEGFKRVGLRLQGIIARLEWTSSYSIYARKAQYYS